MSLSISYFKINENRKRNYSNSLFSTWWNKNTQVFGGKKIANFILRINYCVQLIYTIFQALVNAFVVSHLFL